MSRSDTWSFHLAGYEAAVNRRLETWAAERFIERLWAHDHTLWSPEPLPELTDRLGWLDLPGNMSGAADDLKTFAREVRGDGIETVVLLGMGGSSLAPETFQLVFGHREGYPRLLVLDSTHPGVVQAVHAAITPGRTLFLVSSKSGTTLETLSFFRYFWQVMTGAGVDPGAHFVAITDPGSSLEALASDRGFRRTFPTPPEVGGRYSAMTFFGLVPAALIGLDPAALTAHAVRAADRTRAAGAGTEDPALKLGAVMGELARAGRDKITLLTPASLQAYPAWLEQLIAESLGKDGRSIVPVADEPPAPVSSYGEDRLFVAIRLAAGTDRDLARLLRELTTAGHPVVTVELAERRRAAASLRVVIGPDCDEASIRRVLRAVLSEREQDMVAC